MRGGGGGGGRGRERRGYRPVSLSDGSDKPAPVQNTAEYLYELAGVLKPYFWPDAGTDGAVINRVRSTATYVLVILSKICNLASPLYIATATNNVVVGEWAECVRNLLIYSALRFLSGFFKGM